MCTDTYTYICKKNNSLMVIIKTYHIFFVEVRYVLILIKVRIFQGNQ